MIKTQGVNYSWFKEDPVFGSIILFGLGGIFTELLKIVNCFPPLNQVIARDHRKDKSIQSLKRIQKYPPAEYKTS